MPPLSHSHQQLDAIHAMLAAGHRSVHLERHSLLLLGGTGGFLAAFTELVVTVERFPGIRERAVAFLLWMAFWLGSASFLEVWLTRRARSSREETLPFAQAQITRAWWMLLSMGCLGSFAMFFFGGGGMIYSLWIVLLGLGIYLFGLFSRPLIEWIGLTAMLIGVASLALGLPMGAARWLTGTCFAIGMPLTGWLASRVDDRHVGKRLLALLAWLLAVSLPALLIQRFSSFEIPTAPAQALGSPGLSQGEKVLRLAPGTPLPLKLEMDSPIVRVGTEVALPMTLDMPVEVSLRDGHPDGRFRIGDGPWQRIRDGVLRLAIYRIHPVLQDGKPEIRAIGSFKGGEFQESKP